MHRLFNIAQSYWVTTTCGSVHVPCAIPHLFPNVELFSFLRYQCLVLLSCVLILLSLCVVPLASMPIIVLTPWFIHTISSIIKFSSLFASLMLQPGSQWHLKHVQVQGFNQLFAFLNLSSLYLVFFFNVISASLVLPIILALQALLFC